MVTVGRDRPYDLVLFGATGFTGQLVAADLARRAPASMTVALAGRSRAALVAVRAALPPRAHAWPLLVADSTDSGSLDRMAGSARVVLSTVGPYLPHGVALVLACSRAGTHYADLAGEVPFLRRAIDQCDARARATGARIVPCCGFDSIPSDLGVRELAEQVRADGAGQLEATTLVVRSLHGGVGGGTVATALGLVRAARTDAAVRALLADPYALSPDRAAEPDLGDESDLGLPRRDADLGEWVGPFVMGSINTRVVRRSNALLGYRYGRALRYREVSGLGRDPVRAVARGLALAVPATVMTGTASRVLGPRAEALLARMLPGPGEGPSEEVRRSGGAVLDIVASTSSGARYVERITFRGDPGFTATSIMLTEVGLSLALDSASLPEVAGVLTPAVALDGVLVDRLRAAGMTFDVRRLPDRASPGLR